MIPMPPNSGTNENISSQIQKQVYNLAVARNDSALNNKIYHLQGLMKELFKKNVVNSKMNILHLLYKISLQENSEDLSNSIKPSDFLQRATIYQNDVDKQNAWNIDWGSNIYSQTHK